MKTKEVLRKIKSNFYRMDGLPPIIIELIIILNLIAIVFALIFSIQYVFNISIIHFLSHDACGIMLMIETIPLLCLNKLLFDYTLNPKLLFAFIPGIICILLSIHYLIFGIIL